MTQQFRIDSESLRDKLNNLLPSQSRGSINVDLSGQTTIVPIVDLTETAEGSSLRQDLQRAYSFTSQTVFNVVNTTTTVISTTGYFNVHGFISARTVSAGSGRGQFIINDGTTDKIISQARYFDTTATLSYSAVPFNFDIFLPAGHSFIVKSDRNTIEVAGSVRQIADLAQNLINP